MGSSPFHGIFQSLGFEQDADASPTIKSPHGKAPDYTKVGGHVAADVYEHGGYYIIKIPLAGVRLCDLDIEVSDSIVTIRGQRRQSDDVLSEQYFLQECFWGEFSRSVTLPCTIDPKKVKATFNKECILKVLIPKEESTVKVVRINEA